MKPHQRIWVAMVLFCIAGCVSVTRIAPPVAALETSPTPPEQLERGRHLYLDACASCHTPFAVDQYSLAQWDTILPTMTKRAKLTAADADALRTYIVASHVYLSRSVP